MALPMLVGTSCGPSNPLQGLSKRFDQDRSIQQDYFGANRAGSSREVFRSQQAGNSAPLQEAAHFFSPNASASSQLAADATYDVSALRATLPDMHMTHSSNPAPNQLSSWASDFVQQQPLQTFVPHVSASKGAATASQGIHHQPSAMLSPNGMQWNPGLVSMRMNSMPAMLPHLHRQQIEPVAPDQIQWDKEFNAQEVQFKSSTPAVQVEDQQQDKRQESAREGDELARTAGMLLENIKHEQNPKFQNSQFIGLMQQLRDGMVVVEGNRMVESDGSTFSESLADVKGKGRAIDPVNTGNMRLPTFQNGANSNFADSAMRSLSEVQQSELSGESQNVSEDPNDAYFREENADYQRYWNDVDISLEAPGKNAEVAAWDKLQADWDQFEATSIGIKPVTHYQFQDSNPYLLGDSSRTRHHFLHTDGRTSLLENVLELEAAVQRDVNNAGAWYELGVKQQENEREHKALQALQRAVEADPSHLKSWLALAISYTNDSNRQGTYDAIHEWVTRNDKYSTAVQQFRAQMGENPNSTITERCGHLIQCLIAMARSDLSGEIDADIQIALAVLLNTNEDYEKAQDCFRTALAVRPEDWLLYNRVGATMANSGRAEEALQFYYQALELNPGYIRARFNLGISCINLRRYEEAAQHILDALVLQDSDGVMDAAGLNEKRGVTSTALWDSLRTTCLHMQRSDLANLCDTRDLEGFRNNFRF